MININKLSIFLKQRLKKSEFFKVKFNIAKLFKTKFKKSSFETKVNFKKFTYKLLIIPAILVIIIGVLAGFDNPSEDKLVQDLIEHRTRIMQQAIYGKIDVETAIRDLSEIETYPLFNKDVHIIKNLMETDIDRVRGAKFSDIEQTVKMFTYMSYNLNIKWAMRGFQGDYYSMGKYSVVLKSENHRYKLSEFNLIS